MSRPDGEVMKIIRIVLLVANGGWLLILAVALLQGEIKSSLLEAIPVLMMAEP